MRTPKEAMTTATTNNQTFQKLNHRMDDPLLISNRSEEFTICQLPKISEGFSHRSLEFSAKFSQLHFFTLFGPLLPPDPFFGLAGKDET